MDSVIECGVIIKGEFHRISISSRPTDIIEKDPPWVGHSIRSTKVSFNEYKDGELISFMKQWRVGEINKLGEIPINFIDQALGNDKILTDN